jgi:hypothetical protein
VPSLFSPTFGVDSVAGTNPGRGVVTTGATMGGASALGGLVNFDINSSIIACILVTKDDSILARSSKVAATLAVEVSPSWLTLSAILS